MEPLYRPQNVNSSATFLFRDLINAKFAPQSELKTYHDLYRWSTENISDFWSTVWDYTSIIGEKGEHVVDESVNISENVPWFADARVNWAENMLHCRSREKVALIQASL